MEIGGSNWLSSSIGEWLCQLGVLMFSRPFMLRLAFWHWPWRLCRADSQPAVGKVESRHDMMRTEERMNIPLERTEKKHEDQSA
jgi:hypothetical protein